MRVCTECGGELVASFRFCPWCAAPQRRKLVEFFAPHPEVPGDASKALRVSRYFASDETPPQVRFSIWDVDVAEAAVSVSEEEAARLADFLAPPTRRPFLDQLRESLHL